MSKSDNKESSLDAAQEISDTNTSLSQEMLSQALKIFQESKQLRKSEKKSPALTEGIIEL